jgi:hypothetical protein
MRWAGHVRSMGERKVVYRVLVGKPEGKRLFGRPRHRWEDNIKMDLQEVGWGEWTGLIWLRRGTGDIVHVVMNYRVHKMWRIS